MFEEVKTIKWTCDHCSKITIIQNDHKNWLNRPTGWTVIGGTNPLATNHQPDICDECSNKDEK